MNGVTKKLVVQGTATYTDGGNPTVYLEQVRSLVSFGSFYAYLRKLTIEVDLNLANASGGNLTFAWQVLYLIVKRAQLTLKTADHLFVDCTLSAGQAIWIDEYNRSLKLPEYSTDLTVNNSANGTVFLKLFIPFFDMRAVSGSQEDPLVFTDLLRDSTLELVYCASSQFGSGVTISSTLTTTRVNAEVVPRNEIRTPTLFVLREKNQNGLQDDLDRAGVFWSDLILEPIHAAGNTKNTYAAADITNITLTADGVNVVDNAPAAVLTCNFNQEFLAKAEALGQWEGGGNIMLPILRFGRSNGKKSKLTLTKAKANLLVTGAIANPTTSLRLVERYIRPGGREAAARMLRQAGVQLKDPKNELFPKSQSKVAITDQLNAMTVPWKFYPGGRAGTTPASSTAAAAGATAAA